MKQSVDVLVIRPGNNGLVAALLLARKKLNVLVVEEKPVIGGACLREQPFGTAPHLSISNKLRCCEDCDAFQLKFLHNNRISREHRWRSES